MPSNGDPILMIVGDQHFEMEQHGVDLKSFLNFKRYLDGRRTISEISEVTGLSVEDTLGIVDSFAAHGLIRDEDPTLEPRRDYIRAQDRFHPSG